MDFENYTIGGLIANRRNYDFDNPDFREAYSNIIWRLYQIGYSHDKFKEIDREIHLRSVYQRSAGQDFSIERYGKKYSWIAFYELVGYRYDNNSLSEYWMESPRTSFASIDPSFSSIKHKTMQFKTDFLGNRNEDISVWINNEKGPDIGEQLVFTFSGSDEKWILLDGRIFQEDIEACRSLFILPRGFFVRKNDADEIIGLFSNEQNLPRRLPDIPQTNNVFACEIPWHIQYEDYEIPEYDKLTFEIGRTKEIVEQEGVVNPLDGKLMTREEFYNEFINKIENKRILLELIQKESIIQTNKKVKRMVEKIETKKMDAWLPLREYTFSSQYDTVNNSMGSFFTLNKIFASYLGLYLNTRDLCFYDQNNKIAAIITHWKKDYRNHENLIYIRKDLFDKYLEDHKLDYIWKVWGERSYFSENYQEMQNYRLTNIGHKNFYYTIKYSDIQ